LELNSLGGNMYIYTDIIYIHMHVHTYKYIYTFKYIYVIFILNAQLKCKNMPTVSAM